MVLRNHGVDDGSLPSRLVSIQGLFRSLGFGLFSAAATGLFLAGPGPDGLPYVYLISAAIMPLLYGAYVLAEYRIPIGMSAVAVLAGVFAIAVLSWLLLAGETEQSSWVFYLPMVLLFVPSTFSLLSQETQLGLFYDARQFMAAMPRVLIMSTLGFVAAGVLVPLASLVLPVDGLIGLAAIAFLAMTATAVFLVINYASLFSARPSFDTYRGGHSLRARPRDGAGHAELVADRLLRLLFAHRFLHGTAIYLINFLFLELVTRRLVNDIDRMVSVLALALAGAQLVGVGLLLIVGVPFLFRYGLRFGLLFNPVLVTIAVVVVLLMAIIGDPTDRTRFWLLTAAWSIERAFRIATTDPSVSAAFRIQPERLRFGSVTAAEGIAAPLAAAVAGGLLLILGRGLDVGDETLLTLTAVVTIAWSVASGFLSRGYQSTLAHRLAQPSLSGLNIPVDTAESHAAANELVGGSPQDAALGLEMLAAVGGENYHRALLKLLSESQDEQTLLEVIDRIGVEGLPSALEGLKARLAEENGTSVRIAAMAALVACEPYGGAAAVEPLLTEQDREIRSGAILAMLSGAVLRHHDVAMGALATMVHNTQATNRRSAAMILGETGPAGHRPLVAGLLLDPDVEVREAAIDAVGKLDLSGHTPALLVALEDPRTRRAAAGAIARFGNEAVPGATVALAQESILDAQAVRVLQVMAASQTHGGTSLLAAHVSNDRRLVRAAAISGLVGSPYLDSSRLTVPSRMNRLIRPVLDAEAARSGELFEVVGSVPDRPGFSALSQIVIDCAEHHVTNVFNLLAIRYRRPDLSHTNMQIRSGGRAAAKAKELIDSIAVDRDRQLVGSLIGQRQRAKPGQHGSTGDLQQVLSVCDDDLAGAAAVYGAALSGVELGEICRPGGTIGPLQEDALSWSRRRVIAGGSGTEPRERLTRNGRTLVMAIVEKVEMLRKCLIFCQTSAEDLLDLADQAEQVTVGPGDSLQAAGDPIDALYVVVIGELEETVNGGVPVSRTSGDVIGELELLRGAPAVSDVMAMSTVELLRLTGHALETSIQQRPRLAKAVIAALAAAAAGDGGEIENKSNESRAEDSTIDLTAEPSQLSTSSDLS